MLAGYDFSIHVHGKYERRYAEGSHMSVAYSRTLLISALILLAGCVVLEQGRGFYEPNPDTVPLGPIIEFSANKAIDLINGLVSVENVYLAHIGYRSHSVIFANPKAWTDTAIVILQREFNNRLTRIVKGAEKKLILSVERVSVEQGFAAWRCFVHMKAETGDGYVKMFVGEARSGDVFRAADAALIRAVAEVLKDYDIWKYRQE